MITELYAKGISSHESAANYKKQNRFKNFSLSKYKTGGKTVPGLLPSLALTAACTLVLMAAFEIVKQLMKPEITVWQSHLITISFTTFIAPCVAYFVFRKQELLRQQADIELMQRKIAEKKLRHARAQLEIKVEERNAELVNKNIQLKNEILMRKETENTLRKSQDRYKLLFERIPSVVFHYDNNLQVTAYNHSTIDMFNLYSRELKNYNLRKLPDSRILSCLESALAGREGFYEGPLKVNGQKELFIQVRTVPYLDSNDNISGGILIAENVTERKITVQELVEAKTNAEKSDKMKTEFLAQMSHEIRTPINTVLSFINLIEQDMGDKVNEEIKESFGVIHSAGHRIIRTVDLLLNMSELQTGLYDFKPSYVNLIDILKNIFSEQQNFAFKKGIQIRLNNFAKSSIVIADDYSTGQIFSNLIDNAIKFTHQGRVDINLFTDRENRITVEIEDTGIGISEQYMPNLFKSFSQEEQGYTRKYEGNGLGLALVKKYCELNKLIIKVKSKKREGSSFKIIFPAGL